VTSSWSFIHTVVRVYNLASGAEPCIHNMLPFRLNALSSMSQSIEVFGDYSLKTF